MVYEVAQDDDGLLWVATDNGVSRFDGKRFVNYTTKNGLPSNDVVNVFKQNDGTIWANCYKQPPSYFDEKLNRFVSLDDDEMVMSLSNGYFNDIYPVHQNGIFFHNYLGYFIYSNGKITDKKKYTDQEKLNDIFQIYVKGELLTSINDHRKINGIENTVIDFYKKNKQIGSIFYEDSNADFVQYTNDDGFYRFYENEIVQIKIDRLEPLQFKINRKNIAQKIKWFKFSSHKLCVISTTGTIYIYDEKSLKLISTIPNEFNVNTAYIDQRNNVWVATLNNGLLYYTNQTIKKENYSKDVINNFLCAKVADDGSIYAGNYQGEIYVKKNQGETKYNFSKSKVNDLWIRNIHFFTNKTIVVSDLELLVNFTKRIRLYKNINERINIKSSVKLNEKDLILGSIQGLLKYNVDTEKYQLLNFPKERILNLKRINDTSFYFSANDGLYKYDVTTDQYEITLSNNLFKNDKIQYFEPISSSKIWISTYKGNLFLFDNKKIIKQFKNDDRIPINISKLLHIDEQLWIGSKSGIIILDYKNIDHCTISKLTTSDGLTSNVVNFLDYKKDTIYAATDNGISKIPYPIIPKFQDIKPKVIAIKINEKIVPLNSKYQLKSNENNISLELAGVDLTGHFKNFQYALNQNKFSDIEGNFLNLQLNNGINKILIRVVDENNKIYENPVQLTFEIKTPFYKTIGFWSLITFVISTLLYIYFNRRKLEKQKAVFDRQIALEHQRNKITADLHDDLGASLRSLQINSAVAQKLFDKNPTETKKILKKIESQAKNISENIGDIIWSLKPHKEEFMSLSTRIKKLTSEILGSSDIKYEISIDNIIDAEITDFSARKNLILICKEALNNILKHSQAKKVCVILQKTSEHYFLEILDDGIGFSEEQRKGNGISNMKRRALELGGELKIFQEGGTKLIFVIPIFRE